MQTSKYMHAIMVRFSQLFWRKVSQRTPVKIPAVESTPTAPTNVSLELTATEAKWREPLRQQDPWKDSMPPERHGYRA